MRKIIHPLIRFYLKVTSYFFFEKIEIIGKENMPLDCPVILASNHPNAFLDSIVMTSCAGRPLFYTARGDFFKSKIASTLLYYIQILPVFRIEEGKENLHKNEETFSYCIDILKENGAVSIFPEGFSENKWELRPLRKGTARLAFEAWNNPEVSDKLRIVPVIIHYSSWLKMFPRVYVEFLENIEKKSFTSWEEPGIFNKQFNEKLKDILSRKCIAVDENSDAATQNKIIGFLLKNATKGATTAKKLQDKYLLPGSEIFKVNYKALSEFLTRGNINYDSKSGTSIGTILLLLPTCLLFIVAWIYNFIPYLLSKFIAWIITKGNDFHDSLMYCSLMLLYPIYLVILFYFSVHYSSLWTGIENLVIALISAHFYESSKRTTWSFWKRKKLIIVRQMFSRLFETNNG